MPFGPGPREPIKALGKWTDWQVLGGPLSTRATTSTTSLGDIGGPPQRGRVDAESLEEGGYLREQSTAGMIAAQRIAVAVEKHRPRYD